MASSWGEVDHCLNLRFEPTPLPIVFSISCLELENGDGVEPAAVPPHEGGAEVSPAVDRIQGVLSFVKLDLRKILVS